MQPQTIKSLLAFAFTTALLFSLIPTVSAASDNGNSRLINSEAYSNCHNKSGQDSGHGGHDGHQDNGSQRKG